MKRYKTTVAGSGFVGMFEDTPGTHGFLTVRFVEAHSEAEARANALTTLSAKVEIMAQVAAGTATLEVEEIEETNQEKPAIDIGLTWFPDE